MLPLFLFLYQSVGGSEVEVAEMFKIQMKLFGICKNSQGVCDGI
ncbi:hypothetical protein Xedl_01336 [Xenorhabdus eapokensis]|uniref:Uncharacterized protein n=1 Tax=Xenorhabdus eapokensis TaxID=1873482 RepID=A0A1Q5TVE4_9GAMM|nr:hypothetical protein Xedl_01336 [Xenorhabdus eapokensis]